MLSKQIYYTLILICCCFAGNLSAQQRITVSGFVYDANNQPLSGAAVTVKKGMGTITNANGKYSITLPVIDKKQTLQVSFLGYETQTREIKPGEKPVAGEFNFFLKESTTNLQTMVVTATRTPKLLKDAPIITRVITETEIKKHDATHIGELLQAELPGIEFAYAMNQQTTLNMQGFGGNAILFLTDGERLAGETLENVDYSRLNMSGVDRVEIVKGAASSLYGSNAIGGVVNIVSKIDTAAWAANLNSRIGSYGHQRHGAHISFNKNRLNSTTSLQTTFIRPYSMKNKSDFPYVPGSRTYNAKQRFIYSLSEKWKLTARAGYFFRQRNKLVEEGEGSPSEADRYRDFSGGLKANYKNGKTDDLELSYSFDQYDKSDYYTQLNKDMRDYSNVQHITRGIYSHTFNNSHTLTVGGDYMRDYLYSYQFKNDGSEYQHTADAFVQFDWNPSKRINLIGGARFDYFSRSKLGYISPKLSAMYKVGNCSFRASYSGGFRAPTLKEMFMVFNMGNIFMIYGNDKLKPETSHNYSISTEYTKGGYNFVASGYYNSINNRITTAWNKELNGMRYQNISRISIAGIDLNASAKYKCGIGTRISYSYTREQVRRNEPVVSSTRPHALNARLEYGRENENRGFNVALNARYISSVSTDEYVSITSYTQTVRRTYPGYSIWRLTLMGKIKKGIALTLVADNIFSYVPEYFHYNSPTTNGPTFTAGLSVDVDKLLRNAK